MTETLDMTARARVKAQAREWVVEVSDEHVGRPTRERFEAWLAADPEHARAFKESARVLGLVSTLTWMERAPPARRPALRWALPAGVAAAAAAMLAVFALGPLTSQPTRDLATQVGEVRHLTLADGSRVTLGARSAIDVAFTETTRAVTLLEGEAFFEVEKDPSRPFIVAVADHEVRVVGTKFNVHRGAERISVDVLEGVVEVAEKPQSRPAPLSSEASAKEEPEIQILTAGQQVVAPLVKVALATPDAPPPAPPSVREILPEDAGAWRTGRLSYNNAPLVEVIADANRYHDGEIVFASDALRDLTVTASFRTDRIDQMLATLDRALPVEIERQGARRIILRADDGGAS